MKTSTSVAHFEYKPKQGASPASARLDLRNAMKYTLKDVYFSPSPDEYSKNFGCHMFGQPDTWKGVVGISPQPPKEDGWCGVEVWVDTFRTNEDTVERIREAVYQALHTMQRDGYARNIKRIVT